MPPFQPGPWRRPGTQPANTAGGTPAAPPLVAMVTVNNVTSTTANLVGSVNPQSLAGTWWFIYGTSPPPAGTTTTAAAIAATSIPQTQQTAITGLTTGATYFAAIAAQTAGGTVTSAPLSFVAQAPQPVTNPSNIPPPTGTPAVAIPHYRFPIVFNPATGIGVVEQDTLDEVASNVAAVLACEIGACPELPTFGRPDPTFGQAPLDPAALLQAVKQWEPRADVSAVSQALGDPNAGGWQLNLTTRYARSER